jgi:hypothetical protein
MIEFVWGGMKAITIRNIPPEVVRAIRRKAEKERTSLNKAVIGLIEERLGVTGAKRHTTRHHDLDFLAGSWTRQEGEAFDQALAEQRVIDADLWKGAASSRGLL